MLIYLFILIIILSIKLLYDIKGCSIFGDDVDNSNQDETFVTGSNTLSDWDSGDYSFVDSSFDKVHSSFMDMSVVSSADCSSATDKSEMSLETAVGLFYIF